MPKFRCPLSFKFIKEETFNDYLYYSDLNSCFLFNLMITYIIRDHVYQLSYVNLLIIRDYVYGYLMLIC